MKKNIQTDMPFYDMENAYDLYKKLEYEFNKLTEENQNIYDYMNFIFTANHLKDWVENDNNFDADKKNKIQKNFDPETNKKYSLLKAICNRSKHFEKNKYEGTKIKNFGFDFNNIDFSDFTFNGITYEILDDGKAINLYDLCKEIFEQWKNYLRS